ncbi:MAG: DUF234 domain-containing protein, partial [Campylobacteraceae bacterium]
FKKKTIFKEKSREKPLKTHPKQKLKKAYRSYNIEDKIRFSKGFDRFWFTFVEPNIKLLEMGEFDKVLSFVEAGFEKFVSLEFEYLSEELIFNIYGDGEKFGGFWTKSIEIDLLFQSKNGLKIAGEAKWKNHKVCKNILTHLKKKCEKEKLDVDMFALFSKSGFSKELLGLRDKNLQLFELEDFKTLYM